MLRNAAVWRVLFAEIAAHDYVATARSAVGSGALLVIAHLRRGRLPCLHLHMHVAAVDLMLLAKAFLAVAWLRPSVTGMRMITGMITYVGAGYLSWTGWLGLDWVVGFGPEVMKSSP